METESRTEAGAGESRRGGGEGAGTRRKLNEEQEREVTRLYAETDTPVSEISKRFGIGESSVYRVAQRHGASLRGRTATTPRHAARTTRSESSSRYPPSRSDSHPPTGRSTLPDTTTIVVTSPAVTRDSRYCS